MRSPAGAPSLLSLAWTWRPRRSAFWWKIIPAGSSLMLSVGLCVQLACVWEATARKPGNVHRWHDFEDTSYPDFLLSAAAIAPVLEGAAARPVGQTILEAVRAARHGVNGPGTGRSGAAVPGGRHQAPDTEAWCGRVSSPRPGASGGQPGSVATRNATWPTHNTSCPRSRARRTLTPLTRVPLVLPRSRTSRQPS